LGDFCRPINGPDKSGLIDTPRTGPRPIGYLRSMACEAMRGPLERVAHGVYRMRGAPALPFFGSSRRVAAAGPTIPVWQRTAAQGVVSHRSAAALLRFGDLPAEASTMVLLSDRVEGVRRPGHRVRNIRPPRPRASLGDTLRQQNPSAVRCLYAYTGVPRAHVR
jgi:hypothetical protein